MSKWRVGRHYPIHVYEGDRPVATFFTTEDAARAVKDHNRLDGPSIPAVTVTTLEAGRSGTDG